MPYCPSCGAKLPEGATYCPKCGTPGSGEAEISNFVAEHLESIGLEVYRQDVVNGRQNVIGLLEGQGEGLGLMMNGHTDTVGVEGMTIDPFKPIIKEGAIYGRGACDMKGPLAGMIGAMEAIINSDFLLIQEYHPNAVIVGEATDGQIGITHKGLICLEVKTYRTWLGSRKRG